MEHDPITRALAEALTGLAQASANIAEGKYNTFETGSSIDAAIKTIIGNADLILAAPDLLKAAQMAVNTYPCASDKTRPSKCPRCELTEAITKATHKSLGYGDSRILGGKPATSREG